MRFDVISLFPEMFGALQHGVTGRALNRGLVELVVWNPREFAEDPHRCVDDRPYGGGPGMVMSVGPLSRTVQAVRVEAPCSKVIYMTPQGRRLDQAALQALSGEAGFIVLAGRYEGVDERFVEAYVDQEWSIGDYVLSGGELPAMVFMDALIRLLPGALGHAESAAQDSYAKGLLDCPHYTRPEQVQGLAVPGVLLSGDHESIRRWRLQQALGRTWLRRPDLIEGRDLNAEERYLLDEFIRAQVGT